MAVFHSARRRPEAQGGLECSGFGRNVSHCGKLLRKRGHDPNGTSKRDTVARWKANETIMSGQLMHLEWNSTDGVEEWVKGWNPSTHPLAIPHFSRYDYTDSLVTSSGLLSGLSCLDEYELQTAYFTAHDDLLHGAYVIPDTGTSW